MLLKLEYRGYSKVTTIEIVFFSIEQCFPNCVPCAILGANGNNFEQRICSEQMFV